MVATAELYRTDPAAQKYETKRLEEEEQAAREEAEVAHQATLVTRWRLDGHPLVGRPAAFRRLGGFVVRCSQLVRCSQQHGTRS